MSGDQRQLTAAEMGDTPNIEPIPENRGSSSIEIPASSSNQPPGEQTPIKSSEPPIYNYGIFKRRMTYDPILIVFAILVLTGGIVGYLTKQSTVSLVSSTIFFLLIAVGTYYEGSRKNSYPILIVLLALFLMMAYRYSLSFVFMPSGLVALLALLMLARHSYLLYLRSRQV